MVDVEDWLLIFSCIGSVKVITDVASGRLRNRKLQIQFQLEPSFCFLAHVSLSK